MIFSRKKPASSPGSGQAVLRSRDNANSGNKENPLARRFHPDDEPDTIDLEDPGRFHSAPVEEDPPTAQHGDEPGPDQHDSDEQYAHDGARLITLDSQSGKFYIHPGEDGTQVLLDGEPVRSPTELRRGDTIRIGSAEFQFLKQA
jgi:hypothetical protein